MKKAINSSLVLLFAFSLAESAATIKAKYEGYFGGRVEMSLNSGSNWKTVGGGVFFFERTNGDYNDGPAVGEDYYAMCFEPTEWISVNAEPTWNVQTLPEGNSSSGAFTATQVTLLTELFGRYWPDLSELLDPKKEALAMQIAVWEIVSETGALGVETGSTRFRNPSITGALDRTSEMLGSLTGHSDYMALGLRTMVARGVQDYIFQIDDNPPQEIPEPSHLAVGGLLILLWMKRRVG
jgi:hypothetical protein